MDMFQMKIDLKDIYPTYEPETNTLPQELPNYKIEAELRLSEGIHQVFDDLKRDLKEYNMQLQSVGSNNVIVSGIPPDASFKRQTVLEIVQGHDRGAKMISFSVHEP